MPDPFDNYFQSFQKLEYFLTGGAGAVLAFTLQAYNPDIFSNAIFLLPCAWSLFLVSLIAGVLRLDRGVGIYRKADLRARARAYLDPVIQAHAQHVPIIIGSDTGKVLSKSETDRFISSGKEALSLIESRIKKEQAFARALYHVRNWALIGGLFLWGLWRVINL